MVSYTAFFQPVQLLSWTRVRGRPHPYHAVESLVIHAYLRASVLHHEENLHIPTRIPAGATCILPGHDTTKSSLNELRCAVTTVVL